MSLLDEQSLVLLDTPKKLLSYRGQVHVRDLALMLEEVLYYYRPDGELLVPAELVYVLSEYDKWIEHNAVPLSAEVLQSVTVLSDLYSETADEATRSNLGFFLQESMVNSSSSGVDYTQLAIHLQLQLPLQHQPSTPSSASPWSKRVMTSARWMDIRTILDSIGQTPSSTAMNRNRNTASAYSSPIPTPTTHSSIRSNTNTSITSTTTNNAITTTVSSKRRQLQVEVAAKTVSFLKFARWLHKLVKQVLMQRQEDCNSSSGSSKSEGKNIML